MSGKVNGAKIYQANARLDISAKVEEFAPLVKRIALHMKARLPELPQNVKDTMQTVVTTALINNKLADRDMS